jgi:hypothetical protein
MRRRTKYIVVNVIVSLVVLLLIYAAISKLVEFKKFQVQIGQSPLLVPFTKLVAIGVPSSEILVAVMLLFEKTRFTALYFSFLLMALFSAYIVTIMNFTTHVPCSCGGVLEGMGWSEHLIFNLVFVAAIVVAILVYDRPPLVRNES